MEKVASLGLCMLCRIIEAQTVIKAHKGRSNGFELTGALCAT
jgi:hypothetical protein